MHAIFIFFKVLTNEGAKLILWQHNINSKLHPYALKENYHKKIIFNFFIAIKKP